MWRWNYTLNSDIDSLDDTKILIVHRWWHLVYRLILASGTSVSPFKIMFTCLFLQALKWSIRPFKIVPICISSKCMSVPCSLGVNTLVEVLFASPLLLSCCVHLCTCRTRSHTHRVWFNPTSYFTAADKNVVNCDVWRKAVQSCCNTPRTFKYNKTKQKNRK